MSKVKYIYNNFLFNTKKEVKEFTQSILHKYNDGDFLEKNDYDFIYDLLVKGHCDPDKKIGCGIAGICIKNTKYNNRCFNIYRLDGTCTDFSFVKCITPKNQIQDLQAACRTSVIEDINKFREDYFKQNQDSNGFVVCPFTKQKVNIHNCHVDHIPPNTFIRIFLDWMGSNKISPEEIEIKGYEDGETDKEIVNEDIKNSFIKFHRSKMDLRITSQRGNLSGSKLEYRKYSQ
jgi:hypothetical protein